MGGILSLLLGKRSAKPKSPVFTTSQGPSRYDGFASGARNRSLRVAAVRRETPEAVTLELEPLQGGLAYKAGQFLTFDFEIDGENYRRAYSFSSSPGSGPACITVKEIAGGVVSAYLNRRVAPGMTLRAMPPAGEFTAEPAPGSRRHFVFIAGGSGITPIISLIRHLLTAEPDARINLLYGNRRRADVIFYDELQAMAETHPQFQVTHVLEEPPDGWSEPAGILDAARLKKLVGSFQNKHYYVCGPQGLMDGVEAGLRNGGVAPEHIHVERFVSLGSKRTRSDAVYDIHFIESGLTVRPKPGQSILDAGLDAGAPLNFSCTVGGCGSCMVRVKQGIAVMDEPNCLSPEERAQGYILACVAYGESELEVEA